MKKQRVLVAMSGGVDSSVAALLMKNLGFQVIGAFMKNWSQSKDELGECLWKEERKMAMKIASRLKIPLITLDFEKQYKKEVVEKMFSDYRKGITPNPDIDCNQKIKFPLLIKEAKKLGADFVVTGHYARIKGTKVPLINPSFKLDSRVIKKNKKYELFRAKDELKDQSYFLYRLNQNELPWILFPIGNYTKKEIRKIAKKNNFPNFDKKSTVGICFIGKINLKNFLKKKIKPKKGKTLDPKGNIIGEHDGIYYYTIGQRLGPRYGIEISKENDNKRNLKRWYIAKKNLKRNEIIAAPKNHPLLYRKEIFLKKPHWINEKPKSNLKVLSRIRHVGELIPSKISYNENKKQFKITLNKAITGVSQGQAIVLYQDKKVLGGGEIRFK